jgi:cGMP-dependent protein kinase 2
MSKLAPNGAVQRLPAEVLIKRKRRTRGQEAWEVVRARGHLDEVQVRGAGRWALGAGRAAPASGVLADAPVQLCARRR